MAELDQQNGSLLRPLYPQGEVNQTIDLGTHAIEVSTGHKKYAGETHVILEFVPEERLVFNTSVSNEASIIAFFDHSDETLLNFTDRNVHVPVFQTSTGRFVPKSSVVNARPPASNIVRTIFHLFNFPAFFSTTDYIATSNPTPDRTHFARCSRVMLRGDGWIVTIAATEKVHDDARSLERQGGWLISHVGEIVREDHAPYSSEKLDDLLHCLHSFLSFATGRWVGLTLPVGFDIAGKRVFEQWGMPFAASGRWHGSVSWFDDRHGESLVDAFPGFSGLWNTARWKRPLGEAIYWYLGASDRRVGIGVDTGLIIAQTALELLAWNYCVRDRGMVSEAAFKPRGLSAADKFRLLASSLGIPLAIPNELSALHGKKGEKWADSLDAITSVRNALVHPHDDRKLPKGSEYEAWKLTLWYLDLIILRLCKYNGMYANRLTPHRFAGTVESVPWASNVTGKP